MARKQIVVCDRCGATGRMGTETDRFKEVTFAAVEQKSYASQSTKKELCGVCVDEILSFVNTPPR